MLKNELIPQPDLSMLFSVCPQTLLNLSRDGTLPRRQPVGANRSIPCYLAEDVNEYLQSIWWHGEPAVAFIPISDDSPLVGPHELSRLLGCTAADVASWADCKRVPVYKVRRSRRYRVHEVSEWIALATETWDRSYVPVRSTRRLSIVRD